MNRSQFWFGVLVSGILTISAANASQDSESAQGEDATDGVVAMCEDQYPAKNYTDEDERYNLIDKCIEDNAKPEATTADQ